MPFRRWFIASLSCSLSLGLAVGTCHPKCVFADDALDNLKVKALRWTPKQDVDYEKVSDKETAACSASMEKRAGIAGLLVSNANGQPIRWFFDSNSDNNVDMWCFFRNGIEVYRDIDSDFNGVPDEFRWMGTAGMRWAIDSNEDGKIDRWKSISAEEVTAEVVEALRYRDLARFEKLLATSSELQDIGLGEAQREQFQQKIDAAKSKFIEFAKSQTLVQKETKWVNFGADKPGLIPAGTNGSTEDVVAYDNSVAVIEDGSGKPQQLLVGTLVRVGDGWRLADLPRAVAEGSALAETSLFGSNRMASNESTNGSQEKLFGQIEAIDSKLASNSLSASEKERLHGERADILEQFISQSSDEKEQADWVRQYSDTVSAAAQTGEFSNGVARLYTLAEKLEKETQTKKLVSYVIYRAINAEYVNEVSKPKADFAQVQKGYLGKLEKFVKTYPSNPDSGEAMVQIGLSAELAGEADVAKEWYSKAGQEYRGTLSGKKAEGAARRLDLVGKSFPLKGKTLDGKAFDMKDYSRQIVIVHCWASWCEPCKADMNKMRQLQDKYARSRKLSVVGINLDKSREDAIAFLKREKYPWAHLYDEGGMESQLAAAIGAISLPITIVVDETGSVLSSTTHFSPDIEEEIEKRLTPSKPGK